MTTTTLVTIALLALPVVFLFSATACAAIAGIELPPGEEPASYGQTILTTHGLIGFWRLDEPEDAADAGNSLPPHSHKGTYLAPDGFELQKVGVSKKDGNAAATFDGGYIEVPFDPQLTPAALTVELWLKVTDPAANPGWRDVIGCYVPNAANVDLVDKGYRIRVSTVQTGPGTTGLRIAAELGGMPNSLSRTVDFDNWHYVALTYSGTAGVRLYIDQQPALPLPQKFAVTVGKVDAQPLRFGGNRGDSPDTFRGVLDEIALYGTALDGTTIGTHFTAAQP